MFSLCDRSSSTERRLSDLIGERDAALEIRCVLLLGQSSRASTRRAALGQDVHRSARYLPITHRIGVDRDEHVGVRCARALDAIVQCDEVVTIAREYRVHTGLAIDARGQCASDGERDILLVRAVDTGGARVHATMSRIDRDDYLVRALGRVGGSEGRCHIRAPHCALGIDRGDGALELDAQSRPGTGRESHQARPCCRVQLEHYPQQVWRRGTHAQRTDEAPWRGQRDPAAGVRQIDHESFRRVQARELRLHGPRELEGERGRRAACLDRHALDARARNGTVRRRGSAHNECQQRHDPGS